MTDHADRIAALEAELAEARAEAARQAEQDEAARQAQPPPEPQKTIFEQHPFLGQHAEPQPAPMARSVAAQRGVAN
jgi:hypothetical protein